MTRTKSLILSLSVGLTILINILSNALPFNGQNTAVISDRYFSFFTPAGSTFIIWGVIYVGWLGYVAYHWLNIGKKSAWLLPAFPWFLLSCLANMLWLVLWHYEQIGLSVVVMIILLISLTRVYILTRTNEVTGRDVTFLIHLPISIYLGWISVATIANISSALIQVNWNGLGMAGEVWSAVMILVAMCLGIVMLIKRNDYAFVLVLIWSLLGIAINFQVRSSLVFTVAALNIFLLAFMIAIFQFRRLFRISKL